MNNVSSLSALLLLTALLFGIAPTPIAAAPMTNQPTCQALLYLPMVVGGHETGQAQHAESNAPSSLGVDQPDFNGDGCADLAIGVPREDLPVDNVEQSNSGAVNVLYGTATGLELAGQEFIQQNLLFRNDRRVGTIAGSDPEAADGFGQSLAAGDLNGDGFDDLMIGAPSESISDGGFGVGSVNVLYGTSGGLGLTDHLWISQKLTLQEGSVAGNLLETAESLDNFGYALSVADFNRDGRDDAAIGILSKRYEDGAPRGGAVSLMLGSGSGLTVHGSQFWSRAGGRDLAGIFLGDLQDAPEEEDWFGRLFP